MHRVVFSLVLAVAIGMAAGGARADFANLDAVQRFISGYRAKPDLAHVADAIRASSRLGAFRDSENSGVYVGFLAGIIGANPQKADPIIDKVLAIKAEDHWAIVRAIAYSGDSGWKDRLNRFAGRMPSRTAMIEKFAAGALPTLDDISYEPTPSAFGRFTGSVGNFFTGRNQAAPVTLEATPEVLDTLWGYYFATGSYGSFARIARMLPWSKDNSSADRLTVGSMAKFTLASNAAHDAALLARIKREAARADAEEKPFLDEIVDAVETVQIAHIRKEALAAIDDMKRKGPGYKRDIASWGGLGESALALGCLAAAAAGQVEVGLPCVVGGSVSSAALNFWSKD
jgi:hypothetical protein